MSADLVAAVSAVVDAAAAWAVRTGWVVADDLVRASGLALCSDPWGYEASGRRE